MPSANFSSRMMTDTGDGVRKGRTCAQQRRYGDRRMIGDGEDEVRLKFGHSSLKAELTLDDER